MLRQISPPEPTSPMSLTSENLTTGVRPSRRTLANAIRVLSMDAVQQANSGHPGMPMGMADIAEVLWNDYLRFNPGNPHWFDRDRFVVSNGHGSMLLYSLAHLSGYPLGIDELRNFRQMGSRTAGHPEREQDIGIETTTGPLGQGLANAVGLALAEKVLASAFNRPDATIVDHYTYVFLGDGCLMEGVSHESCSLAGTLGLGKLIGFYDDNGISIDGEVEGWFTDDTPARFRAYGWHVIDKVDGHDPQAITAAIDAARAESARPTLICCQTVIGWGAPNKQGTASTHGEALGEAEVAATRKALDWALPPFEIPADVRSAWDAHARGARHEAAWQSVFDAYTRQYPELAGEFTRRMRGELPKSWADDATAAVRTIIAEGSQAATRKSSQRALEAFVPLLPELLGGSADLTGSNNTRVGGSRVISAEQSAGNYLHYGVREFGMAAIMNGLALHGGFIPYGGTFLVFSDYARNALRMAALMQIRSILVFTHDSIGLGEDGPTHQPVEHLASLRAMPNMHVWRPCDGVETALAWRAAIERSDGPTSLVLTRQNLPHMDRTDDQVAAIARGGYVLFNSDRDPELVIVATGSEVALALAAARELADAGAAVRVVSMPCTQVFDRQDADYRDHVLGGTKAARLFVEAGVPDGWWRYAGARGDVIGMPGYGMSAPAGRLFEHFGFSAAAVAAAGRKLLG